MMVNATLSVVIYLQQAKSMAHWAIYLRVVEDDKTTHLVYQANGDEGELELDVRGANPRASARFKKQVDVSDIDDKDTLDEVKQALENQPMKNEIPTWNCQDWVMEALETLNDESLLDEYQYQEAKQTLEHLYNE